MSHSELFDYLRNNQKKIDIDGNIKNYTLIPTIIYLLVMIIYFFNHIISHLNKNYYPVTLYSTNLYSKFAEQVLIMNKIKYQKIYHPVLLNSSYYLQSKRKTVSFNPELADFNNNSEIQFIPLSEDELTLLSNHTTLPLELLNEAQNYILEQLPGINSYHVVRDNYLYDEDYVYSKNKMIKIERINNLYHVVCNNYSFYTKYILTDSTYTLQPADIVSVAYTVNDNNNVDIQYFNKYIVNEEYRLESLGKKLKSNVTLLPCYTLNEPRQSLSLNPFHLPKSKDFILSIMIITQAILMI